MRVGFDVDGVLCHVVDSAMEAVAAKLGLAPDRTESTGAYTLESAFAHHGGAAVKRAHEAFSEVFKNDESVYERATPDYEWLALLFEAEMRDQFYRLVTRRGQDMSSVTARWLRRNYFSYPRTLHCAQGQPKSALLPSDLTHFIEDSPKEAMEIVTNNPSVIVLLRDAPYNRGISHVQIERVVSANDAAYVLGWRKLS